MSMYCCVVFFTFVLCIFYFVFSGFCDVLVVFFFFFQAEDGIRDHCVTGVQTCALPIYGGRERRYWEMSQGRASRSHRSARAPVQMPGKYILKREKSTQLVTFFQLAKIGRASCRERV